MERDHESKDSQSDADPSSALKVWFESWWDGRFCGKPVARQSRPVTKQETTPQDTVHWCVWSGLVRRCEHRVVKRERE